jgi:hemerythrin-like domain-containing protein
VEQSRVLAASLDTGKKSMKFTDLVPKGIIAGTGSEDAISLLTADHEKVQDLFRQFTALKDGADARAQQRIREERQRIVNAACEELTIHTMLEEEIFYPAVRGAIDDAEAMNEAQVEHDGAKALIEQLGHMTAKNEMFNAKFKVLAEYVNHHIAEEQNTIFPQARMAKLDLAALGARMLERKQALAAGERPARKRPAGKKRVAAQRSPAHRKPQRKTAARRHAA